MTPTQRTHVYTVIAAVVPLLVTLGVITGDVAQHVLTIAAAVLAVGGSALARRHVPDAPDAQD